MDARREEGAGATALCVDGSEGLADEGRAGGSAPDATLRGPSRRGFVIGAAAVVVGVAAGMAAAPFSAEADVLRPPGALAEADFMARCIRCERCISACPTDVLAPLGVEQGLLAVRTPFVTFADNRCTFCDECRKVCPTAAIGSMDPYDPSSGRIGVAVVDAERCVAFDQVGTCGICVDACEYEALSFDDERRPVVDAVKCNGCGECERICAANVFTSFGGERRRGVNVVTSKTFEEGRA